MVILKKSSVDPQWFEIQENGVVVQEIQVHFPLWKVPTFESVEEVHKWLKETEGKQARNRALRLLSSRAYSSTLLLKKLEEKGYSRAVSEHVVQSLGHYINDEDYWTNYIRREFAKGNGPRLIAWKGQLPEKKVREQITIEMQRKKIRELKKKGFQALARKGFDLELLIEFFRP